MLKKQNGFTLIELLVTMVIFAIVLFIAGSLFGILSRQFTQQSRIAESQIEGIIGLEILRNDIEQAGFGLPWNFQNVISYNEATGPGSAYNDSPDQPPRALWSGNNVGPNNADELVVKSTAVAMGAPSQDWTYLSSDGFPKIWGVDDIPTNSRVIVINPLATQVNLTVERQLVMNGVTFSTSYGSPPFDVNFSPPAASSSQAYIIYGVDPDGGTQLRFPFSRADYYLSTGAAVPPRCAPKTYILEKGVISQVNGTRQLPTPLLDCVADFQVVFKTTTGSLLDDLSSLPSAEAIRQQVAEVRVYILTHDGGRDRGYFYPNTKILVGETFGMTTLGQDFDLAANIGGDWRNYRWKVYKITVRPIDLQ